MRGGFKRLVNPGSFVSEVDLVATRAQREALHRELRLQAHLKRLLSQAVPGDGLVNIEVMNETDDGLLNESSS